MKREASMPGYARSLPKSFEDGAFIPDTWLRWLRQVIDAHGALSRQDLEARAAQDVMAVAHLALHTVLADVERVLGTRPRMELTHQDGVRVMYVRGVGSPQEPPEGISTADPAEALVSVADAVFHLLADDERAVPIICPQHGFGLHPRVEGGRATWWCIPGDRVAAEIGHLGDGDR